MDLKGIEIKESPFGTKVVKEKFIEAACKMVVKKANDVVFEVIKNEDGIFFMFRKFDSEEDEYVLVKVIKKLSEGSYGELFKCVEINYETKEEIPMEYALKLVKYDPDLPAHEWYADVISEAALLTIFSATQTGPAVPNTPLAFSEDSTTACYVMELFDADLANFVISKPLEFLKFKNEIENQLREAVHIELDMGIVCVDLKPNNCLVKVRNGEIKVVLTDFGGQYCCSLVNSIARRVISSIHIEAPPFSNLNNKTNYDGRTLGQEYTSVRKHSLLSDGIRELYQFPPIMCSKKRKRTKDTLLVLSLALIGGAIGLFPTETERAINYMNPKTSKTHKKSTSFFTNKDKYPYKVFLHRWQQYKHSFLTKYKTKEWYEDCLDLTRSHQYCAYKYEGVPGV